MVDWETFKYFFALTSFRTMASSTAKMVPGTRNRTLMTRVFRVTAQAQVDEKKYSKFFRPTKGLIMPVL